MIFGFLKLIPNTKFLYQLSIHELLKGGIEWENIRTRQCEHLFLLHFERQKMSSERENMHVNFTELNFLKTWGIEFVHHTCSLEAQGTQ